MWLRILSVAICLILLNISLPVSAYEGYNPNWSSVGSQGNWSAVGLSDDEDQGTNYNEHGGRAYGHHRGMQNEVSSHRHNVVDCQNFPEQCAPQHHDQSNAWQDENRFDLNDW